MLFYHDIQVTLEPESHTYSDQYGVEYDSVSKVKKHFKHPFDAMAVSRSMATPEKSAFQIREEWNKTMVDGQKHGSIIHDNLELYDKTGKIKNEQFQPLLESLSRYFNPMYTLTYPEKILFLEDERIAGTADKPCFRKKVGKVPVIDIFDYKTYLSRGVEYESRYGKWLKPPVEYLEDCNFIDCAIQLSIYGYMMERTWGYKVGKLAMIYIPADNLLNWQVIPVPYMRMEAERMIQMYVIDRDHAVQDRQKKQGSITPGGGEIDFAP